MPLIGQIIALQQAGHTAAAKQMLISQARPSFVLWLKRINSFIDLEEQKNHVVGQEAQQAAERRLAAELGGAYYEGWDIDMLATDSVHHNATGNPALATAGTGDVLAGWLGGAWARRQAASPLDVAVDAVRLHGLAADRSAVAPLRAADLIEAMLAATAAAAPRGG